MLSNNPPNTKRYNLYNLELNFHSYLDAGNVNKDTIKNYLSDFRHFAGFAMAQTPNNDHEDESNHDLVESTLTENLILDYRNYLSENKLPIKTINRRLSTIRKLCSFCISQGWMKENPAKDVINVLMSSSKSEQKTSVEKIARIEMNSASPKELLDLAFEYENTIRQSKVKEKILKREMIAINEFLTVIN